MKTIYLIRHSAPFVEIDNYSDRDNVLWEEYNRNMILSPLGEENAKKLCNVNELKGINEIYASNSSRAIETAKYLAEKNNLEINVISDFWERKFGIDSWNQLPENFERKQFLDENYKIGNGESQKEVSNRMYSTIMKILDEYKNKRIAIVSHATAISYLLKKWCDIDIVDDKLRYSFNNNVILNGYFNFCETFKLEFDDNNILVNIQNINLD